MRPIAIILGVSLAFSTAMMAYADDDITQTQMNNQDKLYAQIRTDDQRVMDDEKNGTLKKHQSHFLMSRLGHIQHDIDATHGNISDSEALKFQQRLSKAETAITENEQKNQHE